MVDDVRVPPDRERRDETQALPADLSPEVAATTAETNRYIDSLAEALRTDIRFLARRVAENAEALERFRLNFLACMDEHFDAFHRSIEDIRRDLSDVRQRQ